ncbi:S53 family peptidase [Lentilactobacillus kisonensis]|nr:S53 family peptidase [Lentilactobacillus kisonensis]
MKRIISLGISLLFGVCALSMTEISPWAATSNPIGATFSGMGAAKIYTPSPVKPTTTSFDIFLKPRNEIAYYQRAEAVNTPGNQQFKAYLTPTGIREQYGQPVSITNQWVTYLKQHHLKSVVYHNGLLITVSGKVANIDKLFKVNLNQAQYHSNPVQFSSKKPTIPATLAKSVWAVLGMGDHNKKYSIPDTNDPLIQRGTSIARGGFTSQFVNHYNVQPLYNAGLTGKGQTIGIIAFGNIRKGNAYHFWKHEKANSNMNRFTVQDVPGTFFRPNLISRNEGETTMDVEYAGSVAPEANVRLYWVRSGIPAYTNLVNAYATAFNENRVSSLSCSFGIGGGNLLQSLIQRKVLSKESMNILNFVMAQGALQGTSNFTASGDTGALAYDVNGQAGNHLLMNRSINGIDPVAANSWITSVGGTTLPFSRQEIIPQLHFKGTITVPKERAWGWDYLFPAIDSTNGLAHNPSLLVKNSQGSGGGFNTLVPTPAYQVGVPGVNTFNARNYVSNLNQPTMGSPLLSGTGTGRNYPDVSADADPMTGYKIYFKTQGIQWPISGGTSIVSPQYAAMAAVINSQPNRPRMGFWNPQIYQLAQGSESPFTPLNDTENNANLYYTGQPGTVYNQASGLGVPNFAKLAQAYK